MASAQQRKASKLLRPLRRRCPETELAKRPCSLSAVTGPSIASRNALIRCRLVGITCDLQCYGRALHSTTWGACMNREPHPAVMSLSLDFEPQPHKLIDLSDPVPICP